MFVEKPVLRGRNARILPDFAAFLPSGPAPQVLPKLCTGLVSARGSFLKASAVASALGAMVNLYAMGVGAEKFGGVYDNTEIFHKLAELTSVQ